MYYSVINQQFTYEPINAIDHKFYNVKGYGRVWFINIPQFIVIKNYGMTNQWVDML